MPKTLILFQSLADISATIAEGVADGARSVRFSEVEIRLVDEAPSSGSEASEEGIQRRAALMARYQLLADTDELLSYDAIIVGASSSGGSMNTQLTRVLARAGSLTNKVGAAFSPAGDETRPWTLMQAMAGLDMILVPPAHDGSVAAARALGKRVAEVTSWITHARSHHHAH